MHGLVSKLICWLRVKLLVNIKEQNVRVRCVIQREVISVGCVTRYGKKNDSLKLAKLLFFSITCDTANAYSTTRL